MLDEDDEHEEEHDREKNENHDVDLQIEKSSEELILSMTGTCINPNEPSYLAQSNFLSKIAEDFFYNNANNSSKLLASKKFNSLNLYLNRFLNKNENAWIEADSSLEVTGCCLEKDSNLRNDIVNFDKQFNEPNYQNETGKINLFEKCVQLLKSRALTDLPVSLIADV